ncbi:MAG: NlpC/P60 family protein [Candidatus Cryptobacteroides sp.]
MRLENILCAVCAMLLFCGNARSQDAVIAISVAQLRLHPDYESPLETQALMGTPAEVLDSTGYWRRIRVPDGYEAWVNALALVPLPQGYDKAEKYIVTADWSHVFDAPSENAGRISDLVRGDVLRRGGRKKAGFVGIVMPSGQTGWVRAKDVLDYGKWQREARCTADNVVAEAMRYLGVPYLWGGCSTKGFDCSGIVQFSYWMNGMLLPRNSSAMYRTGTVVEAASLLEKARRRPLGVMASPETASRAAAEGYALTGDDLSELRPGDLIFFGNIEKDRPTHVTMYIGGGRIIHASQLVRINSLDPGSEDCYENVGRMLGVRRIIQ